MRHCLISINVSSVLTLFRILKEVRHKRLLGLLHELHDALLDGILVLVQPAVDIVLYLYSLFVPSIITIIMT